MDRSKADKITTFTKYQQSLMDVEGYIIGLLTCSDVNLGLPLKNMIINNIYDGKLQILVKTADGNEVHRYFRYTGRQDQT